MEPMPPTIGQRFIDFFKDNVLAPLNRMQIRVCNIAENTFESIFNKSPMPENREFVNKAKKIETDANNNLNFKNKVVTQITEEVSENKELGPNFTLLPQDLILNIFDKLDRKSARSASLVNKQTAQNEEPMFITTLLEKGAIPTDKILEKAKKAGPFLNTLSLRDVTITSLEEFKDLLKHCPNIQSLNLAGCQGLTEEFLDELPLNLKELHIMGLNLSDHFLEKLAQMQNLESLNITWCQTKQTDLIDQLAKLKNLKSLDIGGGTLPTPIDLTALNQMQGLEALSLSSNNIITDAHIDQLIGIKNLKSLDLSGCSGLTDEALFKLNQMPHLVNLSLSQTHQFTAQGLANLPIGLESLTMESRSLTNSEIDQLVHLKNLKFLNISLNFRLFPDTSSNFFREEDIKNEEILDLNKLASFPSLRTVDLSYTNLKDEHIVKLEPLEFLKIVAKATQLTKATKNRLRAKGHIVD